MLSKTENDRICRVAPDQPMGRLLRRHWLPALMADALKPNGDPELVELVGENFVAWRNEKGEVGFFDQSCLHRGASMHIARSEGDGLRCIYHGWKFAVDGTVLDTPNVADPNFKGRVRGRVYPTREAGGLVWVYLGSPEHIPDFPAWPWMSLPDSQRVVVPHYADCNFVQITEGLVDSSHLGILHSDGLQRSVGNDLGFAQKVESMQRNLAPRLEAEDTPFGFYYAALRDVNGSLEARVTAFVAPFTVLNPNGDIMSLLVPASDTRTVFYHAYWSNTEEINREPLRSKHLEFLGLTAHALASYGITQETARTEARPTAANRFHQNRAAMRDGRTFSGMPGLIEEDVAVCLSAGPIRDRSREMLCPADIAIRKLYNALQRHVDLPDGALPPTDYSATVGTRGTLESGQDWRSLVNVANELPLPLA